ncbi:MAG: peptide chain release factor 1 [Firmicutes bacterium]|nr:peptide chain release factor 1 [Bacillota bacterium]
MNTEKLRNIKTKYEELTRLVSLPETIADNRQWAKLAKEQSALAPIVEAYDRYAAALAEIEGAKRILSAEKDPEMQELAREEIEEKREFIGKITEELKVLLLPPDPDDDKDVILEVRAGAGGDEAGLFGYELLRMYRLFADSMRWKVEDIDAGLTELGGIKEAVVSIRGKGVYKKLKFESGVHRVQRVPTTETQGRVHTSTVTVAVLPEAEDVVVEINEKDLKIDTYRSSGAGGQHVNKTESAIRITHIPSGIVVQCQDGRSQIQNRERAMQVLKSKLYEATKTAAEKEYAGLRRSQVGTGDRSERIRTYNYPQGRVTDHRIGMTLYNLEGFLSGNLDGMLEALLLADQTARLEAEEK